MQSVSVASGEQRTWDVLGVPPGFDEQLHSPAEDGGPHAAVEGVRCQPEQLVARVGGERVDQEAQVHSHHSFAQQDV